MATNFNQIFKISKRKAEVRLALQRAMHSNISYGLHFVDVMKKIGSLHDNAASYSRLIHEKLFKNFKLIKNSKSNLKNSKNCNANLLLSLFPHFFNYFFLLLQL